MTSPERYPFVPNGVKSDLIFRNRAAKTVHVLGPGRRSSATSRLNASFSAKLLVTSRRMATVPSGCPHPSRNIAIVNSTEMR